MGTIIPTISEVIQPYSVTPVLNSTTFPEDIDTYNGEQPSRITSKNTANTQANAMATAMNTVRDEVQENADATETNALIAKGAANFQGDWVSDTLYIVGQSVYYNSAFYVCKVENSDTIWTEANWRVNVPLGAVGNINSPLLDLPLQNSLSINKGVGSVTFTRATTATYIDRYGVLQYVGIDEPRFEKEGLLIEGASTNIITNSNNMLSDWLISSSVTVALETVQKAPDSVLDCHILEVTASSNPYLAKSITLVEDTSFTFSMWVKKKTTIVGDFKIRAMGKGSSETVFTPTDDWTRVQVSDTALGTTMYPQILSATVGNELYIAFAQIEELPFASSYIPTTTTAVTRAKEICTVQGTNNVFLRGDSGTTVVEFDILGTSLESNQYVFYSTGYLTNSKNNVDLGVSVPFTEPNPNTSIKITGVANKETDIQTAYKDNVFHDSTNGLVNIGGTLALIYIGSDITGNRHLFGHVKNIKIYDIALTDTEASLG